MELFPPVGNQAFTFIHGRSASPADLPTPSISVTSVYEESAALVCCSPGLFCLF